jgi:hypothetical protein
MTVTLGRLLLVVGILVITVSVTTGVLVWQARAGNPGGGDSFREQATAICREGLPAVRNAPDLETALAANREMRARLSALTPPAPQRSTFDAWLLALEGAENAALDGNREAVTAYDGRARNYATTLGVGEACILDA